MKRIPKRFKLQSHEVTVRQVKRRDWDALTDDYDIEGAVGAWRYQDHTMIILANQTKSMRFHTFTHELIHSILDAMGDPIAKKLNKNEVFVDRMAGLLAQALETAE